MAHVPLLDLTAQYDSIRTDVDAAIRRVVESQRFVLGEEVAAFEREIADYIGVEHAIGVSSGTDALLLALMAFDIGPGDEVVTTPFSFFATAGVITRQGARPVFADIEPDTLNISPAQALACFSDRTRAVIPVDLYGRCAATDSLRAAAAENGIVVIEDAAQAIGASDATGRAAGTLGDVACFSFFPTKNLGAFGDAGLVTSADAQLAERMRMLRVHGMAPKYFHALVGGNFRLDALQAAVLRVKLAHLDAWTAGRRANAGRYRAMFADADLTGTITVPADEPGHVYNQFVIRTPERDRLRAALGRAGIGTEIYYPVPLHLQECFRHLGIGAGACPVAEAAAREVLALPIYPELGEERQALVVAEIARFFESN